MHPVRGLFSVADPFAAAGTAVRTLLFQGVRYVQDISISSDLPAMKKSISLSTWTGGWTPLHRGRKDLGISAPMVPVLGMRRLGIIDIDSSRQGLRNDGGSLSIVYDGELCQFRALRGDSRLSVSRSALGATRKSCCVIRTLGVECLARFNGMFAFAISDAPEADTPRGEGSDQRETLVLLHRYPATEFASEVKAILAARRFPTEIDPEGLSNFVALGPADGPSTMYQRIHNLLPGAPPVPGRTDFDYRYRDVDRGNGEVVASDMSEDGIAGENLSSSTTRSVVAWWPTCPSGVPERRGRLERGRGARHPARDRADEDVLRRVDHRRRIR